MTDRERALTDTLREWRATGFAWGERDCVQSVLTYAGALCGRDLGAPWRGRYGDRAAAAALLAAEGGMVGGLGRVLEAAGFHAVLAAARGDIVVSAFGSATLIAGLWLGGSAAFRIDGRGVLDLRADHVKVLAAWH